MSKTMNYSFLRGKIVEVCGSNTVFAEKLGISTQELSNKLNNKSSFTQKQIDESIVILSLGECELGKCVFCI